MTLAGLSASRNREIRMTDELENDSRLYSLSSSREKREQDLEAKHSREKIGQEYLEKTADFLRDAVLEFWAETPGKTIDLKLSSPEAPSEIRLRIDGSGKVADVTDEFPL
jgi:hypothetical protein